VHKSLNTIGKLKRHGAITSRVCGGGRLRSVEDATFGNENGQVGRIPLVRPLRGQPAMARFSQHCGYISRWAFRVESEPGQEHLLDLGENCDEQSLSIGGEVKPGVIEAGINQGRKV